MPTPDPPAPGTPLHDRRADDVPPGALRYTVEELARAVGMSTRNIRAHQTRRLLDPPVRSGRTAYYDGRHLRRLMHIRSLQDQGFNLVAIEAVLAGPTEPGQEGPRRHAPGNESTGDQSSGHQLADHQLRGHQPSGHQTPGRRSRGRQSPDGPVPGRDVPGETTVRRAAQEPAGAAPADGGGERRGDDLRAVLHRVAAGHPRLIDALARHGVVHRLPDGTVRPVQDRLLRTALELDRAGLSPALSLQVLAEVLDDLRPVADELGQVASARLLALLHRSGRTAMPSAGRLDRERLHPGLGDLLTEVFRATVRDPAGTRANAGHRLRHRAIRHQN